MKINTLTTVAASLLVLGSMSITTTGALGQTACDAYGGDLASAKGNYALSCPDIPRADCDPTDDGQWQCSSGQIGSHSPLGSSVSVDPPDPAPTPALPPTSSSECVAVGSNRVTAIAAYEASCMAPRVDCDPIDGGWSCSSGVIGSSAPSRTPTVSTPTPDPTPTPTPPPTPDPTPSDSNVGPFMTQLSGTYSGRYTPQGRSWADSYSVGDTCYMWTGFDHGIGSTSVTINGQTNTVRQWSTLIETGPGIDHPSVDAMYNDVRCGNGPANNNGDEDRFPVGCNGRVDIGQAGCGIIGPSWKVR